MAPLRSLPYAEPLEYAVQHGVVHGAAGNAAQCGERVAQVRGYASASAAVIAWVTARRASSCAAMCRRW
jgi:hypothetical protein